MTTQVELTVEAIVKFLEQERGGYAEMVKLGYVSDQYARGARAALGYVIGRLTGTYPND